MQDYSVIIPALNEEANIASCLNRLRSFNPRLQVIVVDGGSVDQTPLIAEKAGVQVVRSQPGRGIQCNRGAKYATGSILIFLHADTQLPENTFLFLDDFFSDPRVLIGSFRLRFDYDHWFLKLSGYCTRFDSILTRFGDQCIVVRRGFFDDLGGFPEWPLFEDVDFLRRSRRKTKIYSFPAEVITSARKFKENGPIRQQIRNGILVFKYLIGISAEQLAREYRK